METNEMVKKILDIASPMFSKARKIQENSAMSTKSDGVGCHYCQ